MNRMISNGRWATLTICSLSIAMLGSSCPNGPGPITGKVATITNIGLAKDGLVAAGNGIIAFGNDAGGVSYINVGSNTVNDISGTFRTDAVFCAGRKVILVADAATNSISVHDTTTGNTVNVPNTDVFDMAPGSNLEHQWMDVDGNLIAILHRGSSSTQLKLIDVTTATPVVTTYTTTLVSPHNVDLDAVNGKIVVMEDNQFATVFDISLPANQTPVTFDVVTDAGITISSFPNTLTGDDRVMFPSNGDSVKLLNLADNTLDDLTGPSAGSGTTHFEIRGGLFAYFLNRGGQGDFDGTNGFRLAIGDSANPTTIELGSGDDLGAGIREGFGHSTAIAPDGNTVYLSGRFGQSPGGGVNEPTALQCFNVTNGWDVFTDSSGDPVYSGDVVASSSVVAFKVQEGNGAVLGYYVP